MSRAEYDNAVTAGFILGARVVQALYDVPMRPEVLARIQDYLEQMVRGEATVGATPAEMRMRQPHLDAALLEELHRSSAEADRQNATAVLRDMKWSADQF